MPIRTTRGRLLDSNMFRQTSKGIKQNKKTHVTSGLPKKNKIIKKNPVDEKIDRTISLLTSKINFRKKMTKREEEALLKRIKMISSSIKKEIKVNRTSALISINNKTNLFLVIKDLESKNLCSEGLYKKANQAYK
jgi:hypothetical protein